MKAQIFAGVIAALSVMVPAGASALNYKWAEAVSVDTTRDANEASVAFRNDSSNALGAPDADANSGFFSLGLGHYADFTFGSGGPFTGASIVFEFTNPGSLQQGYEETANVFAFLGASNAPTTNSDTEASYVTRIPNEDAQSGFVFNVAGTFDTIRIWDTSPVVSGRDGFDVDAVGVVPLPAAAWLLLGVSGALVAAKRRSARKAA